MKTAMKNRPNSSCLIYDMCGFCEGVVAAAMTVISYTIKHQPEMS